ncbi:hypothetical protein SD71_12330 [Cohnella kolymensis]|uniref:DUF2164 domain-containing protein n=1 Tax=Cohnella kolymensis TaxID=1590652 RepID=A0ABR5A3W8_9BACL|nr:DUF2164 domain-containing protein [Cohnella kolymensis]KIL35676.1 hypothetical protein SD71_12330 [Cohnella kolymensis]
MLIPIKLPKEQKDEIIRGVIAHFESDRGETIGELAAEQLVDLMIKEIGPYIYNKAIEDSRQTILQKTSELEEELYAPNLTKGGLS